MTTLCALCRAVDERALSRPDFDSHLYATPHFVVMPAVGPITPGHVLVVSRHHLPNLGAMGPSAITEYCALVSYISSLPAYRSLNVLEAEHGASVSDGGGSCITHVHINLIPGFGEYVQAFDGTLRVKGTDPNLADLTPETAPYIMLRSGTTARVLAAPEVPSQLIRKKLFAEIGRDDWDWAAFPQEGAIADTLRMWGIEPTFPSV
jgi:diadenosine tetraphosphate (Ap4A) HIT family hydrolase